MRASTITTVLVVLATAGTVHAKEGDLYNTLGTQAFDKMTLGVWVGSLAEEGRLEPGAAAAPVPFDQSGLATMVRFQWGVYGRKTRFDTVTGVEGHIGLGWLGSGAISHEGSLGGMKYGRFFHDFDAMLNAGLLYGARWRIAALGGFGYSTDRYYLIAGGKLQLGVAGYGVELWGHWRPGYGYGGRDSDEVRFGATVASGSLGWGAGVEYWKGDLTRDDGTAPRGRALRGDYTAILAAITKRW